MKPKTNRIKKFLETGITEVHKVKGYKRAVDWKKYLESEEGKKYLEEINKNYDNYLDGKE